MDVPIFSYIFLYFFWLSENLIDDRYYVRREADSQWLPIRTAFSAPTEAPGLDSSETTTRTDIPMLRVIGRVAPQSEPAPPQISPIPDARDDLGTRVRDHVQRYLGPIDRVLADSGSPPIEILVVEPWGSRNWFTLVTCGMSRQAIGGAEGRRERCELLLALPSDWPGEQDPEATWPIEWLRRLGRLPQVMRARIAAGHTFPNGTPPQPLARGVAQCGWLAWPPVRVDRSFLALPIPGDGTIHFLALYALYRQEIEFKLEHTAAALVEHLERVQLDEIFSPQRPAAL